LVSVAIVALNRRMAEILNDDARYCHGRAWPDHPRLP
jgi:hypothetical protein